MEGREGKEHAGARTARDSTNGHVLYELSARSSKNSRSRLKMPRVRKGKGMKRTGGEKPDGRRISNLLGGQLSTLEGRDVRRN